MKFRHEPGSIAASSFDIIGSLVQPAQFHTWNLHGARNKMDTCSWASIAVAWRHDERFI